MTRALLQAHPLGGRGYRILECAAGRGAITRVLRAHGCEVVENDWNQEHGREFTLDMRSPVSWETLDRLRGPFDYVVTNLPFNVAIDILRPGISVPRIGFISLLLKSFDEPTLDDKRGTPRGPWLQANPWDRKICLPRHSFRGEGSPSMASDWFVWYTGAIKPRDLPPCVVMPYAKDL